MPKKTYPFEDHLFRTDRDIQKDSVAAGVAVSSKGFAYHAVLVITYESKTQIFHFDKQKVRLCDNDSWDVYICKTLDFIVEEEIEGFLSNCITISQQAKPQYGYYYCGSYYKDGELISNNLQALTGPHYMTCVGFCLSVIKTFFSGELDFIDYMQWNDTTTQKSDEYLDRFVSEALAKFPNLTAQDFKRHIRRIWPIEYLTAAFSDSEPVGKAFVQKYLQDVQPAVNVVAA